MPDAVTYAAREVIKGEETPRRYLIVFPDQDLFILQPESIVDLDWSVVWGSIPTFRFWDGAWMELRCDMHSRQPPIPQRHLAVEYDPAWDSLKLSAYISNWGHQRKQPAWQQRPLEARDFHSS